jgi:hypothetical protein
MSLQALVRANWVNSMAQTLMNSQGLSFGEVLAQLVLRGDEYTTYNFPIKTGLNFMRQSKVVAVTLSVKEDVMRYYEDLLNEPPPMDLTFPDDEELRVKAENFIKQNIEGLLLSVEASTDAEAPPVNMNLPDAIQ